MRAYHDVTYWAAAVGLSQPDDGRCCVFIVRDHFLVDFVEPEHEIRKPCQQKPSTEPLKNGGGTSTSTRTRGVLYPLQKVTDARATGTLKAQRIPAYGVRRRARHKTMGPVGRKWG